MPPAPAKAIAVIPARFASTRLPGKPLLDRTGKPMIVHVCEAAARASRIERVIVATDDERIAEVVRAAGYDCMMTRADHPNGTSRIAEVVASLPPEDTTKTSGGVIVNVQGDEPQVDPAHIDALVDRMAETDAPMATVASPFQPGEDPADPNIVKLVADQTDHAMYFSRALIPFTRDASTSPIAHRTSNILKHAGLYAYRRAFLAVYTALPPTPCEQAESLEQLRALEHGHRIALVHANVQHTGIDTPQQYEAFVQSLRQT